ncbi:MULTISPECIES: hypothetical protein [unclassified Rhodococcus (in: high G+C Gram-positive bacteria)]|uniref:YncE family protein n=1 Tax=unclassified Rhodococcus (in: high G+C Gram-positive bacteria) TaxID=192944 RepID=UPI001FFB5B2A|nr:MULTISPECIES: hypothetical protein [unclassified Rhodococcus (in: high G+C Gram-positive bacteria)]
MSVLNSARPSASPRPQTYTVESTVPVGKNPVLATTLDGTVYVTNAGSGDISAHDTVIATVPTGGVPVGIASAAGRCTPSKEQASPSPSSTPPPTPSSTQSRSAAAHWQF